MSVQVSTTPSRRSPRWWPTQSGYQGEILWDTTKPDGTPQKLLDVSRLSAIGWKATVPLAQGLADTYRWFLGHLNDYRR